MTNPSRANTFERSLTKVAAEKISPQDFLTLLTEKGAIVDRALGEIQSAIDRIDIPYEDRWMRVITNMREETYGLDLEDLIGSAKYLVEELTR